MQPVRGSAPPPLDDPFGLSKRQPPDWYNPPRRPIHPSLVAHPQPLYPQPQPHYPQALHPQTIHPSIVAPASSSLASSQGVGFVNPPLDQPFGASAPPAPPPDEPPITYDEDELPLLEELGIYPADIWLRMRSVLLCRSLEPALIAELDMTGPVLVLLGLGCCLLLAGKVHFGYLYALSSCGALALWALLNLMSQSETLDIYRTLSILGYSLLPIDALALTSVLTPLMNPYGLAGSALAVLWSTFTAARFFEAALYMKEQRFLIAYPVFLFYASFVLLTVF